ncbi:MAG: hypothetical protein VZR33_03620 [Methanosphaera sp.]|nr:hypothetical protein [Methanosphaera sp.]
MSLGVISFKAVTNAAGEGAIAVKLFDKAFVMTKIGAFIAGVTAVAAAIYAVVTAW